MSFVWCLADGEVIPTPLDRVPAEVPSGNARPIR